MFRPRLSRTHLETGLEALSLLGLPGGALLVISWPNRVPGHYDLAGTVTRYDPKGTLWGVVGSNAGAYTLMSVMDLFPQFWNLPGGEKRVENPIAQGTVSSLPWWFLPLGLVAPLVMIAGWLYLVNRELHGDTCMETQPR